MNEIQIPKLIHYCWFGKKELPPLVKKCIISWKKHLPDYEFKLWNEENFDINSNEWCKSAYLAKKYAFVADYCRLIKLYEYGGVYLDTDIKLYKSLNKFIYKDQAFMGYERNDTLSMGVMGFPAQHPIIKELLNYYKQDFDPTIIAKSESNAVIATKYLANKYGLLCNNSEQYIKDIHIYPKTFFNPMDFWGNWDKSKDTICVHLYMGSWLPQNEQKKLRYRKTFLFKICKFIWEKVKNITLFKYIRNYLMRKNII